MRGPVSTVSVSLLCREVEVLQSVLPLISGNLIRIETVVDRDGLGFSPGQKCSEVVLEGSAEGLIRALCSFPRAGAPLCLLLDSASIQTSFFVDQTRHFSDEISVSSNIVDREKMANTALALHPVDLVGSEERVVAALHAISPVLWEGGKHGEETHQEVGGGEKERGALSIQPMPSSAPPREGTAMNYPPPGYYATAGRDGGTGSVHAQRHTTNPQSNGRWVDHPMQTSCPPFSDNPPPYEAVQMTPDYPSAPPHTHTQAQRETESNAANMIRAFPPSVAERERERASERTMSGSGSRSRSLLGLSGEAVVNAAATGPLPFPPPPQSTYSNASPSDNRTNPVPLTSAGGTHPSPTPFPETGPPGCLDYLNRQCSIQGGKAQEEQSITSLSRHCDIPSASLPAPTPTPTNPPAPPHSNSHTPHASSNFQQQEAPQTQTQRLPFSDHHHYEQPFPPARTMPPQARHSRVQISAPPPLPGPLPSPPTNAMGAAGGDRPHFPSLQPYTASLRNQQHLEAGRAVIQMPPPTVHLQDGNRNGNYPPGGMMNTGETEYQQILWISSHFVPRLVGTNGACLAEFEQRSGATMKYGRVSDGTGMKELTIIGTLGKVEKCVELVKNKLKSWIAREASGPARRDIWIPNTVISSVIGKGGWKVAEFQLLSGASISIEPVSVSGHVPIASACFSMGMPEELVHKFAGDLHVLMSTNRSTALNRSPTAFPVFCRRLKVVGTSENVQRCGDLISEFVWHTARLSAFRISGEDVTWSGGEMA
uniref:K Homology domain-containing protein n=1 Tax=Chromera velia CCMP2878 TaxID=1169474 RepID=A0A0G4GER8_9ALVE|eukprot:Cvel_21489.t1-p1 / transcript=Cvel_21489.t1 / gene=Cvel_21489 / organism=Chromera_velia_CCMP2878 / gene_product=hypothetical protein / transcript_product=hypothetical protein / location=Cvel_scaffold2019:19771-22841(+) / protein_length=766 / sequence_SO=supercontig / SO=protein_coding / is_pseudo=false